MGYEEFVMELKKAVTRLLGEGYEVRKNRVMKNNDVERVSLTISRLEDRMTPNLYMEGFYEVYRNGASVEEVARAVVSEYQGAASQVAGLKVPKTDFESSKPCVTYRLVGFEGNEKILADSPHIRFLDWAITFHSLYSKTEEGVQSFRITNKTMKNWGTTAKELYRLAHENTPRLLPVQIKRIEEVLLETMQGGGEANLEIIEEGRKRDFSFRGPFDFWVMTNDVKVYGATTLLYPDALKELAEGCGRDVYVIPSSVHEMILVPDTGLELPKVESIVREINDTEVLEEEVLGQRAYVYRRETGELER